MELELGDEKRSEDEKYRSGTPVVCGCGAVTGVVTSNLEDINRTSSIDKFISGLPSFDSENFTRCQSSDGVVSRTRRPTTYLPTGSLHDHQEEQIIVSDDSSILLRFLNLTKEKRFWKRDLTLDSQDDLNTTSSTKKRIKL